MNFWAEKNWSRDILLKPSQRQKINHLLETTDLSWVKDGNAAHPKEEGAGLISKKERKSWFKISAKGRLDANEKMTFVVTFFKRKPDPPQFYATVGEDFKKIYRSKLLPLEEAYDFHDFDLFIYFLLSLQVSPNFTCVSITSSFFFKKPAFFLARFNSTISCLWSCGKDGFGKTFFFDPSCCLRLYSRWWHQALSSPLSDFCWWFLKLETCCPKHAFRRLFSLSHNFMLM